MKYLGRLAPTPTGYLHLGHASTFSIAHRRAREAGGRLLLRIEDLDPLRCRSEFSDAAMEDLRWLGIEWDGDPVFQSHRRAHFLEVWQRLKSAGRIYPCQRSRREISTLAPHEEDPIFPIDWRSSQDAAERYSGPGGVNWRFRVPDGLVVNFYDQNLGYVEKVAQRDFGDFLVWNRDDVPAYELAVVADDTAMGITEVVRGADLLTSTARQILIYEALEARPPAFYHCPLVCDQEGRRLAKRSGGLSIRELREAGKNPKEIFRMAGLG